MAVPSKKPSWLPIVGALLIPLTVAGAMLVATTRERQAEGIDVTKPPTGGIRSAFVEVQLLARGGTQVADRRVTFIHQQAADKKGAAAQQTYSSVTDSSGVATVSLPQIGSLTIEVEGMKKKTLLPAMEMHGSREIKVRLVVD